MLKLLILIFNKIHKPNSMEKIIMIKKNNALNLLILKVIRDAVVLQIQKQ